MNLASRLALTLAIGFGLVTPEARSSDKRAVDPLVAPPDEHARPPATPVDPQLATRPADPAIAPP